METKNIIIVGAGGHAAELRDYIDHIHRWGGTKLKVVGFLDDQESSHQHYGFSEAFLGPIQGHVVRTDVFYLMGIANLAFRRPIIENFISQGGRFTGLIHPTALISPSAEIGEGVVISHNASVGPKVKLGRFNMLNSRSTIGHDSVLGDFNFISPQVAISGSTRIGDENLIGTNACTIPGMTIGNRNKIGAGMVVYKPVGDDETVFFHHKERVVVQKLHD